MFHNRQYLSGYMYKATVSYLYHKKLYWCEREGWLLVLAELCIGRIICYDVAFCCIR